MKLFRVEFKMSEAWSGGVAVAHVLALTQPQARELATDKMSDEGQDDYVQSIFYIEEIPLVVGAVNLTVHLA
jgi:hypothetical protein